MARAGRTDLPDGLSEIFFARGLDGFLLRTLICPSGRFVTPKTRRRVGAAFSVRPAQPIGHMKLLAAFVTPRTYRPRCSRAFSVARAASRGRMDNGHENASHRSPRLRRHWFARWFGTTLPGCCGEPGPGLAQQ